MIITGNNCIIRWIVIYRVDSAVQRLNNRGLSQDFLLKTVDMLTKLHKIKQ